MIGALVAVAAVAYAAGVSRARRWPARRSASFAAGLVALAVALLAPDESLSGHMAEHVLLTVVAAPLLVLGAPHALWARRLARPLRVLGALAWWPIAWSLFAAATLAVHLTGLFDYGLDHPWAHALEHSALLGTALLFWFPVLAAPPAPRRLGPVARVAYLIAAMAPMGAIGALLDSSSQRFYDHYSVAAQAGAGAIMWVTGGWALVAAVVAAAWAGMVAEERRQTRREMHEDAGPRVS